MSVFDFLELEEQVGQTWHRLAGSPASYPRHADAAVLLAPLRAQLAVFFHALGGDPALRVAESAPRPSRHRLSWRQRLAVSQERMPEAKRDAEAVRLPPCIDCFPDRSLNRDLYFWLAAFLGEAAADEDAVSDDPLRADLGYLRGGAQTAETICRRYPGLREIYRQLCRATLAMRPARRLPATEAAMEAVLKHLLGASLPPDPRAQAILRAVQERPGAAALPTPRGYRRLLPVLIWGNVENTAPGKLRSGDDEPEDGSGEAQPEGRVFAAKREENDECERNDALILNRFEKILGWSEMINLNRPTEDEDEQAARRAAEDHDYLSLSRQQRKASTRLKLELDLRPAGAEDGVLRGEATYPEWDYQRAAYRPDFCRVLERVADSEGETWQPDEAARRRIRHVRRQFEALRPRRLLQRRELDGFDLDMDAAVRARSELAATGQSSEQIFEAHRCNDRDLVCAILTDVSLSTDAWVENRRVLDVEKEALMVLAHGLSGCGDTYAISTFTSRRRESVRIETIKDFQQPLGAAVERRIAALRPGAYTRIGAALRHATGQVAKRGERHRLILLLTDGKPNDMDHYEGRYGVEDTRMAVREARQRGICVFAITIDRKAGDYVPYIFGPGGYAIVGHVARLPAALPLLYRHLTR